MMCQTCIGVLQYRTNLISNEPGDDGPRTMCAHHRTTETLEAAANEGCYICHAFWDQVSDAEQSALRIQESIALEKKNAGMAVTDSFDQGGLQGEEEDYFEWLTFTVLQRDQLYGGEYVLMMMFSGDNIDWNNVSSRKTIALGVYVLQPNSESLSQSVCMTADSTSSAESWSLATRWLAECVETHTACCADQNDSPWFPTRLLDLGDIQIDGATIRLIQTSNEDAISGPYCTLSHCWGKAHFIQLNERTSSSLRLGISIEQMPVTFRDAIAMTKRLGIRYIWIDSLCIIQDSHSDWLHEAGLMHKIYSHSYCNISASASVDSSEGLFRSRNPLILQSNQIDVCVADVDPSHQHVRCDIFDYFFWLNNLLHCTINKRGWVFQERLLAPRVLHFGKEQLMWECRARDACESYPYGLPPLYDAQIYTNFKALDPKVYVKKMASQGRQMSAEDATYRIWNALVRAYSQALLTVPGDKLIALSGLAKRMMSTINDDYVAGMWRKRLAAALSWQVSAQEQVDGSPSSRPTSYRAPTWSWASVDGMIQTEGTEEKGLTIRVEDVKLEYATEDITGIITGGWLDLTGPLRPMRLTQFDNGASKRWYMVIQDVLVRPQDESLEAHDRLGPILHFDIPPPGDDSFEKDNNEKRLFFMACRKPSDDNEYIPLLLLRLADVDKKHFERFGVAISGVGDGQEMLLADVEEEVKSTFPCLRYEDGLHTIRII